MTENRASNFGGTRNINVSAVHFRAIVFLLPGHHRRIHPQINASLDTQSSKFGLEALSGFRVDLLNSSFRRRAESRGGVAYLPARCQTIELIRFEVWLTSHSRIVISTKKCSLSLQGSIGLTLTDGRLKSKAVASGHWFSLIKSLTHGKETVEVPSRLWTPSRKPVNRRSPHSND